jgi:hypothetical protein
MVASMAAIIMTTALATSAAEQTHVPCGEGVGRFGGAGFLEKFPAAPGV